VVSDIVGVNGRRMVEALIAGKTDSQALAALAHRRVHATPAALYAALRGRVKTMLIQCAWAAARKKDSYLEALYLRIRSRRGAKKAIEAVATSMLTATYHMLRDGTFYEDPGSNYFDNRTKEKHALRLVNRAQNLGFHVQAHPTIGKQSDKPEEAETHIMGTIWAHGLRFHR
jgi:hypothetical protein